jgi:hypothetical protein
MPRPPPDIKPSQQRRLTSPIASRFLAAVFCKVQRIRTSRFFLFWLCSCPGRLYPLLLKSAAKNLKLPPLEPHNSANNESVSYSPCSPGGRARPVTRTLVEASTATGNASGAPTITRRHRITMHRWLSEAREFTGEHEAFLAAGEWRIY